MFVVFLVDDDPAMLRALSRRLRLRGYETRPYASPQEFLAQHDASLPGCAVLDVSMPDLDGLELQRNLAEGKVQRPVIFLTGKGDVPTSVRAMRAGAIDFLTKPVKDQDLLDAIARAERQDAATREAKSDQESFESRLATLTPREHEVMSHVAAGRLNKQIAADLGTVVQTIKVHRRRTMQKLGLRSTVELMRMAEKLEISVDPGVNGQSAHRSPKLKYNDPGAVLDRRR